jgi:long-chain acyl-CoA synthetase
MDADGYVFIVDRKKDMIIAGGYNVYPREIDEVLYEHPKIADAVSIGVPDAYRGETVKVFVVVKPEETLTEEEVIAHCKEKLAAYKVPRLVEFRQELPKSMVGKVLRKELRAEESRTMEGEGEPG